MKTGPHAGVNVKMWCPKCQASTRGEDCDCTTQPLTACAGCGWCSLCETDRVHREVADDAW